jgi:hypothetical protein
LKRTLFVITPGATWAIKAIGLIDAKQVFEILLGALATKNVAEGGLQ